MRKDMNKVLVTTPRVGSSMKNGEVKKHRRQEREGRYSDMPGYSSMKPKSHSWDDRKAFNEYLNPLVRFLQKNCNRPWDKVYSEICINMDRRSTVKEHIFQHLFDYVKTKPIFKGGRPYETGSNALYPLYKTGWTFYVDGSGLLKEPKTKRPPWKNAEDTSNLIKTEDSSVFIIRRQSDGVWFRATLVEWEEHALCTRNADWVSNLITSNKKIILKTLSKKEKKKFLD